MSVKTPEDLVNEFAKDLTKPVPTAEELKEQARQDSPAMAGFVDIVTKDLVNGEELIGKKAQEAVKPAVKEEKVLENENELRNAFAASVGGAAVAPRTVSPAKVEEKSKEIINDFKKEAEDESTALLTKMLKGLR